MLLAYGSRVKMHNYILNNNYIMSVAKVQATWVTDTAETKSKWYKTLNQDDWLMLLLKWSFSFQAGKLHKGIT